MKNHKSTQLAILLMTILVFNDARAHGDATVHGGAAQSTVSITKGDRVVIDVLELCRQLAKDCKAEHLQISTQPTEGVLFDEPAPGTWAYQHAGTSTGTDTIEFSRITAEKGAQGFSVTIEVALFDAEIRILEPQAGRKLSGGRVSVTYAITGSGFDHLHLQLDEEHHVSLYPREGEHEFTGLKPGNYTISATLARSDHRPIASTRKTVDVKVVD